MTSPGLVLSEETQLEFPNVPPRIATDQRRIQPTTAMCLGYFEWGAAP